MRPLITTFDVDDDPERPYRVTLWWPSGAEDVYRWSTDEERTAAMREFGAGPPTRFRAAQALLDTPSFRAIPTFPPNMRRMSA